MEENSNLIKTTKEFLSFLKEYPRIKSHNMDITAILKSVSIFREFKLKVKIFPFWILI